MIEAELKARLRYPGEVRSRLERLAEGEPATYWDVYHDRHDHTLDHLGCELRVREVETATGRKVRLTYKDPSEHASGSKPEWEVGVDDAGTASLILARLGYPPALSFTKRCTNFRFTHSGRDVLATVVEVPELDGTFLEVETLCEPEDLDTALEVVRQVLTELGVGGDELTDELYTDAVKAARD
jgi:adenylate cyclase class 2